jgi:hypothetical protein
LPRDDAARFLLVTPSHLTDTLRHYITHKSASTRARGPRNVGYLYLHSDLECVQIIMDRIGCTARDACVSLRAIRALELSQELGHMKAQLSLAI